MRSLVAGLVLVLSAQAVAAEPAGWPGPRVSIFKPDWDAARAAIPAIPSAGAPADVAALTAVAREMFPAVVQSPVPVLLPLAIADLAHDRAADATNAPESYASEFRATKFFLTGPTGYDATFSLRVQDVPGLNDIGFKDPVIVQISAFALLYDLPEPRGAIPLKSGDIEKDLPGLRRQILESTLRYSFERFGIPYVVSIQCYDGPQRRARLSCKNADRIAARFMRALRFVGGNPSAAIVTASPAAVTRPEAQSDAFSYHPVGKLVAGSGMRAPAGDPDKTVYARIRFPAAIAPAFVNSQKFGRKKAASTQDISGYVWRDNFCEKRDFFVGQCPSGRGHQGQDIRGASCEPKDGKVDCRPHRDDIVAARSGMILREAWNDSFFLVANDSDGRLRFRHLHMHPRKLDDDGIMSGHMAKEGDRLGTVGNYSRRPGLTSTHLHFELQVPTRDGWVRVNPYMTLIASYEHLINARGRELSDPPSSTDAAGATAIAAVAKLDEQPKADGTTRVKRKPKARKTHARQRHKTRVRNRP